MDNKPIRFKNLILGVGLVWIIPLSLGGIFWVFSEGIWKFSFPWVALELSLGVFLFYGGLTQLVYTIPLILFFRKKNNLGLVRGIWIGMIMVLLANIVGVFWFNRLVEKAHHGTTKGNIGIINPGTPVFYGGAKKALPTTTP